MRIRDRPQRYNACMAADDHVVFHESEEALVDDVARYCDEGLARGEGVVAVVPEARIAPLRAALFGCGIDATAAVAEGRLCFVDADHTLAQFMANGLPDAQKFEATLAALGSAFGTKPFRIYAEMGRVLWQGGPEALWRAAAVKSMRAYLAVAPEFRAVVVRAGEGPAFPVDPARRRVLLIEDNADVRVALKELLEDFGHEVEVATDGKAGLQKLLEMQPDVALVDVGLPGIDGYEVARRARAAAQGRAFYLVALTGFGGADARKRAEQAGFDRHIVKPLKFDELSGVLARAPRMALAG